MKESKDKHQKEQTQNSTQTAQNSEGSELKKFSEELKQKEAQISEYTDHLKRLQAEFENYCKRVEKERKDVAAFASERLMFKILNIVDDFDRALKLPGLPETVKHGFEIIFKNLCKILDEEKVSSISAVGQKFDPYKHEVMLNVESDKPAETIVQELQRGYTMNGKVIRYSKVAIAKNKEQQKENNKEQSNDFSGGK